MSLFRVSDGGCSIMYGSEQPSSVRVYLVHGQRAERSHPQRHSLARRRSSVRREAGGTPTSRSGAGLQPATFRLRAGCSASIWSAPDGSSLLTWAASSVQTAPDGYRPIVWMIKWMIKAHPTKNRMPRRLRPPQPRTRRHDRASPRSVGTRPAFGSPHRRILSTGRTARALPCCRDAKPARRDLEHRRRARRASER